MTSRKRPPKRRAELFEAPLSAEHDSQVLTFVEWCRLNRLSERTGRRILESPGAPTVTMLSARRIGITVGNNRKWQASRSRAATLAA